MKKILLILLLTVCVETHAQLYIGGNAGLSFANYKAKTPWKEVSNMGFSFGLKGFQQLFSNFGVAVELQYIQKGYYHKVCNDIYDELTANYLDIPIMMDYSFKVPTLKNWRAHFNLGIYGAYWSSAKYKMKGFDQASENFDFVKNNASRFDFGPNVGGRIEYVLKAGMLSLDFRYELGLSDMQKQINDNTKNSNRALIIGVTYLKPLGK